ncbi:MAG: putative oxidoreductase [Polaribacter sp.]|jgi:putative oxidoreductase
MKDKILLGVSVLLGLIMTVSGLNKFLQFMQMPEMPEAATATMEALGASGWIIALVAIAEIVGGILLMIPKTRALGAIVLFPIILGVFLFHVVQAPEGIIMGLVLLAINVWVIFENKEKYMPMING